MVPAAPPPMATLPSNHTAIWGTGLSTVSSMVASSLGPCMDAAAADYNGRTALHLAAGEGNGAIVRLLLKYGRRASADLLSLQDRWGHTPIDDARERGHHVIVDQLAASDAGS